MSQMNCCPLVVFIGISGPSGSGKSTYARHVVDHLHVPFYPIELDHFFLDPLIIDHPILGRIKSYEQSDTLNIKDFSALLHQIKHNPGIITRYHRDDVSINSNEMLFVIVEGFLLFALSDEITNLFDIKIFLDSTLPECRLRRFRRRSKLHDTLPNESVIVSKEFQQWFDHLVWDEYLKQRDLQMEKADKIFHSNEYQNKQYASMDGYIAQRTREIIQHQRE